MVILSPSILAADFTILGQQMEKAEEGGNDYFHFDVMDGMFVPNISFGIPVLASVRRATKKILDVHLMVQGEERVEIASPEGLTLFEQRDDFYAYRGEAEQSLILRPGSFLVVFPEDAHRIKIQVNGPETVSKVVFKLLVYEE